MVAHSIPTAWTALTPAVALDKIRGKAGRSLRLENRALGVRSSNESVLVGGSTAGPFLVLESATEKLQERGAS